MIFLKKTILPILLAFIWISVSEFVRNQFLLSSKWVTHYKNIGLIFPSQPINGAVWGLWSILCAIAIFIIARKFSLIQTVVLTWILAFVMMWVAIGNLGVLPYSILYAAVPMSILEIFIAALIIKKLS